MLLLIIIGIVTSFPTLRKCFGLDTFCNRISSTRYYDAEEEVKSLSIQFEGDVPHWVIQYEGNDEIKDIKMRKPKLTYKLVEELDRLLEGYGFYCLGEDPNKKIKKKCDQIYQKYIKKSNSKLFPSGVTQFIQSKLMKIIEENEK